MLGALSIGETRITGLLEAADVLATARIVGQLGAGVVQGDGVWTVTGRGIGGLANPAERNPSHLLAFRRCQGIAPAIVLAM